MINNINTLKNDIYINRKNIYYVYFTSFPNLIYDVATHHGNMGFAGIGLGLIYNQRIFWTFNLGTGIGVFYIVYYKNNLNIYYYYINIFLFIIFICLHMFLLNKNIYLLKKIKHKTYN